MRSHDPEPPDLAERAEPDPLAPSRAGVVCIEGYGLRLRVRRGMLEVEDDAGPNGRRGTFVRSAARGMRFVLLGRGGSVTVEALRWLADVGAAFAVIDAAAGRVVASSGAIETDLPRLRRLQAIAPERPVGIGVSRFLLCRKVKGQLSVLRESFPDAGPDAAVIADSLRGIETAGTIDELRIAEARSAAAYWGAWSDVGLRFVRKDEARVPRHWQDFGGRGSPMAGGPRLAGSPINALLNLGYALGEIETRHALLTVGLDPGLGIVHADQRSRDNFGLDLLEAIRPDIDRYVLALIRERTFAKADFYETTRGVFRVGRDLARGLADTLPMWRRAVAPVAEEVARMIAASADRPLRAATKLTEDARSKGRDGIRRGPRQLPPRVRPSLPNGCRYCGLKLEGANRTYCDDCLEDFNAERLARFQASGPAALARMRAQGYEPTLQPEARAKMSKSMSRRGLDVAAWDRSHGVRPDPEVFRREILPGLQGVPLARIVVRTGLSLRYASLIRRGEKVPHPMHWETLRECHPAKVD